MRAAPNRVHPAGREGGGQTPALLTWGPLGRPLYHAREIADRVSPHAIIKKALILGELRDVPRFRRAKKVNKVGGGSGRLGRSLRAMGDMT